jgi:hypothetical protein
VIAGGCRVLDVAYLLRVPHDIPVVGLLAEGVAPYTAVTFSVVGAASYLKLWASFKGSALPCFCYLVLCEGFFGKFFGWEGFGCLVFLFQLP